MDSWKGTKWSATLHHKRVGVDCTHFVVAVLDEMSGKTTPLPPAPQDAGFHRMCDRVAAATFRATAKNYNLSRIEADNQGIIWLQPLDIVVCKVGVESGAGHVMIAGAKKEVWHSAYGNAVHATSVPLPDNLMHMWRPDPACLIKPS